MPLAIIGAAIKIITIPINSKWSKSRVRLYSSALISGALFSFNVLFQRIKRMVGSMDNIPTKANAAIFTQKKGL